MGPCSSLIRYLRPLLPPKAMRHSQVNSKLVNLSTLTKSPPPTCCITCRQWFSTFQIFVGNVDCPNPRHEPGFRPSNSSRQPAIFSAWVRDTEVCWLPLGCP